jgi:hypothetical protein
MAAIAAPPALAFECPAPQQAGPGVLAMSAAEQAALSAELGAGDMENRIGVIVTDLRRRHPGVARYALVNALIGAYCPAVKAVPGLTDAERTTRLDQFAETVFDLLADRQL